ncbi:MAG: hypothetical protein JNJ70_04605 [Verrucomicrobiales bacterium]|nr:hypothetical protein [Verrucomicrobiales bacterium]
MIEQLGQAPFSFWLHLLLLVILFVEAVRKWQAPWTKPALAVYGTVTFWYTGDYVFSRPIDYQGFEPGVVSLAFFQICFFLLTFRALITPLSARFCAKPLQMARPMLAGDRRFIPLEFPPRLLKIILPLLILGWVVIFGVGLTTAKELWPALIWPPLHPKKVGMYPLTGLGGGASFIFNAIAYLHLLICSLFGVVAVMSRGPVRWIAVVLIAVTWPYFWYDAIRSKMLALILPGLGAFLLTGNRSIKLRVTVVVLCGIFVVGWFGRVMLFRGGGANLAAFSESTAVVEDEVAEAQGEAQRRRESRLGLDMLKELCWINTFIESGRYRPTWGGRYLAELVNPIPRSIWPGKPMVGIDYAIARGFGGSRREHGAYATVATGMIGQGCVNFGRFFGVPAAALLFALWAAFLSRLWCQRFFSPLRLALFLIGMGLTLNTGRDFTLLVLFPFLFGYLAILLYESMTGKKPAKAMVRPLEQPARMK